MVALRKESVDRNDIETSRVCTDIEVALRKESVDRNVEEYLNEGILECVALRKESVDRNYRHDQRLFTGQCRSPQGERG